MVQMIFTKCMANDAFLNALDALILKIPFPFFAEFWASGAQGSVAVGLVGLGGGGASIEPLGGRGGGHPPLPRPPVPNGPSPSLSFCLCLASAAAAVVHWALFTAGARGRGRGACVAVPPCPLFRSQCRSPPLQREAAVTLGLIAGAQHFVRHLMEEGGVAMLLAMIQGDDLAALRIGFQAIAFLCAHKELAQMFADQGLLPRLLLVNGAYDDYALTAALVSAIGALLHHEALCKTCLDAGGFQVPCGLGGGGAWGGGG